MMLMYYTYVYRNLSKSKGIGGFMDFANRGNRPNQPVSQQPAQQSTQQPMQHAFQAPMKKSRKINFDLSRLGTLAIIFSAIVVLVALTFGLTINSSVSANKESALILPERYQAVFLDSADGQVYFGKLSVYNKDLYRLTDIFYVRVENPIQPEAANAVAQPNISLAKLGEELHGPEDYMFISRERVLYWENLKTDGKVALAIKDYVDKGRKTEDVNKNTRQTTEETTEAGSNNNADTTAETPAPGNTTKPETETTTPVTP